MQYTIKDLQNKQLELLRELDRVCELIGVPYYLAAGTALGALRHGGFIPWDDDIDVFMHWRDTDKLMQNRDLFKPGYFFQCPDSEPNNSTVICRLRDSRTTCITEEDKDYNINHGVFIDIYTMYPYPDNPLKAQKIIFDSFILRILQAGRGPKNHGRFANTLGSLITRLYSGAGRERKKQKIFDEYKKSRGRNYYSIYYGEDVKLFWARKYPAEWFGEPSRHKFEDIEALCPADLEDYCKFRYGEDCLQLPPEEKRVTNHDFIHLDLETPYTEFEKKKD